MKCRSHQIKLGHVSVILFSIFFIVCLFPFNAPIVKADLVNDALTLAKAYLDRSYTEFNSTYAAMHDLPGLPFTLYDATEDKWLCPAKKTEAVNLDGPEWGYYGGCIIDSLSAGVGLDRVALRYRWDTEYNLQYDGLVMYVELITLNNVAMKCYARIESKADAGTLDLYFDTEKVIASCAVGNTFDRTHDYGWFTTRFVVRHGTKIAANMYYALGETDKAEKLLNLWYGSGYTKDAYDGVWGESNSYVDYIGGVPWAANGYEIVPDVEVWGNIPWFHYPDPEGVPYRSQLHNTVARTVAFATNPLTAVSWWASGFTFKLAWACHLLNKYGTGNFIGLDGHAHSALEAAKDIILETSWNGLGINEEVATVFGQRISLWSYGCYVPYANAEYLAALSKYYELTGDEWFGTRADEVAGILLKVQVKADAKIRVSTIDGIKEVWRPDNIGGFLCGYKYGGGFNFGSAPFWFAEYIFTFLTDYGLYQRDLGENSACGWTNHETTLMSYAGLYAYSNLIGKDGNPRTPLASEVEFECAFSDAQTSTQLSGGGYRYATATNDGTARLAAAGDTIWNDAWAQATFSWGITIAQPLQNFRAKLVMYVPYSGGLQGANNRFDIFVQIYSNFIFVAEEQQNILINVDNVVASEKYVIFNDLVELPSLPSGPCTIRLILKVRSGVFTQDRLGVGYIPNPIQLFPPTNLPEPLHIETFGYDYDAVIPAQTPTYDLNIVSVGPGSTSPSGLQTYTEGTVASIIAVTAIRATNNVPLQWSNFSTAFGNWSISVPSVTENNTVIISLGGGSVHWGGSLVVIGSGTSNIWNAQFVNAGFDVVTNTNDIEYGVASMYINQLAHYLKNDLGYKNVYLFGYSSGGCAVAYEISSPSTDLTNSGFETWNDGQPIDWYSTGVQENSTVHGGSHSVKLSDGQVINRTVTRALTSGFRASVWIRILPLYGFSGTFSGLRVTFNRGDGSIYVATVGYNGAIGGLFWEVWKDGVRQTYFGSLGYEYGWMHFQIHVFNDRIVFMWSDQWDGQHKGTYSIGPPYFNLNQFKIEVKQDGSGYNTYVDDFTNEYKGKDYDGAVIASAPVDWNSFTASLFHSLDFAPDVVSPTCFVCGVADNFYTNMKYYYNSVSSSTKEWHDWSDWHDIFLNTELNTGKTVSEVVSVFIPFKYFWFWIINNTILGTSYTRYCPLEILFFTVDHDYNVTAYFGNVSYSIKGAYPLTIYCDINMDSKVDMMDLFLVCKRFGKVYTHPDWESSFAKMFDLLLHPDNKIDMIDLFVVAQSFGDLAP